jgi:hypothetical protein
MFKQKSGALFFLVQSSKYFFLINLIYNLFNFLIFYPLTRKPRFSNYFNNISINFQIIPPKNLFLVAIGKGIHLKFLNHFIN